MGAFEDSQGVAVHLVEAVKLELPDQCAALGLYGGDAVFDRAPGVASVAVAELVGDLLVGEAPGAQ